MSLFAAYASATDSEPKLEEKPPENDLTWLENKSFPQEAVKVVNEEKKAVSEPAKIKTVVAIAKQSKKICKPKSSTELIEFGDFSIDKEKDKLLLMIPTIPKRNCPKYNVHRTWCKKPKRKRPKRYFKVLASIETEKKTDSGEQTYKQEEELSKSTAFYNRSLDQSPHDVHLWIKYIRFQDTVYQFEKFFKKGSNVKGTRVTAERKLSILEKALSLNPDADELHRERVLIAEQVYPADEMSEMMRKLVDMYPGNTILWQGYIEATQCSMAHCNTPSVLEMYKKCLGNLHQHRRSGTVTESKILNMLYQCGLFLRQSGLWEQLYTILKLHLELNFEFPNRLINNDLTLKLDNLDKELLQLEEVILVSNLPSHELWLRIEKLREASHWLPWNKNTECEDPQRLVFNEDVSDLIQPITCPGNTFRLAAIAFTLLKVPLLPCRHTTMNELSLDYVPWALDALELLLPTFLPISTVKFNLNHLLSDIIMFTVGPQYLRTHPGQTEYLDFVLNIMKLCAERLIGDDQMAVYTWWLTFQRLLCILNREEVIKIPSKQFKTNIKNLLKQPENRNNLLFYREYALIEFELNQFDSAVNILVTAIKSNGPKAQVCSLYRTLIELLLRSTPEKAIPILNCLALNLPISFEKCDYSKALSAFEEKTDALLQNEICDLKPVEQFLPNLLTDWIICHAWFIYLTKSPLEAGGFLDLLLEKYFKPGYQHEVLMETYVGMLHRYCVETVGIGAYTLLNQTHSLAIKLYPNNLYFLATLAQIENVTGFIGRPWYKINDMLTSTNHCLPRLFSVLLMGQRMAQFEKSQRESITLTGGPFVEDPCLKNRMSSLFHTLTHSNSISKRCGLIWRLYLKFLYHRSTADACRNVYYLACEECPWLKALYIDAAVYIPEELPQIQDLLIEKQLRLHLTPEELEILRT